jgi:hypothetical protein
MLRDFVIYAVLTAAVSCAFGQDPLASASFREHLQNSAALSQLEMDGAVPFHLKASLKWISTGNSGSTVDSGTIEALWKDSHHYRITIILPSGKLVENDDGEHTWRTGSWILPQSVILAERALLSPFLEAHLATDRVSEGHHQEGKPTMDCIDTAPDIPGVSPDATIVPTTYCLAKGNHLFARKGGGFCRSE